MFGGYGRGSKPPSIHNTFFLKLLDKNIKCLNILWPRSFWPQNVPFSTVSWMGSLTVLNRMVSFFIEGECRKNSLLILMNCAKGGALWQCRRSWTQNQLSSENVGTKGWNAGLFVSHVIFWNRGCMDHSRQNRKLSAFERVLNLNSESCWIANCLIFQEIYTSQPFSWNNWV